MQSLNSLSPAELKGKTVLYRVDYNLPMQDGVIQDDTRMVKTLSTLRFLMEAGAKTVLITHLGRPKGEIIETLRLDPIAEHLESFLGVKVNKLDDCIGTEVHNTVRNMNEGGLVMLENLRFHAEEKENDPQFSKSLADLADLFVNDAFGVCHREHASTVGITKYLKSYAGFLLQKEVQILTEILEKPTHPFCLIVGGAKIDTKIGVLERFLDIADYFLIGGAMANTFLAAEGYDVGDSLYQEDKIEIAQQFLIKANEQGKYVYLPVDLIVADKISDDAEALDVRLEGVEGQMKILDIGAETCDVFQKCIDEAKTIIWNGPMGLYEYEPFAAGTKRMAHALANAEARTIVGGGDSIDALNKFKIEQEKFTHISTGGGAMLEFLEGKDLPGIQALC